MGETKVRERRERESEMQRRVKGDRREGKVNVTKGRRNEGE